MQCISYDTETTGLSPYKDGEIFAYSTCDSNGEIYVGRTDEKSRAPNKARRILRELWDNVKIAKVMHNAKFDLSMTEKYFDRRLAEDHPIHDTMIQSHLLQNDHHNHALKQVAWELAGVPRDDEEAIKPYTTGEFENYSTVPNRLMREYQKRDAERTMLLHMFFYPKIKANAGLLDTYETEMELIRTTLRMEGRGVMVHRGNCIKLREKLKVDCEIVLQECEQLLGERINLGNDNRIRALLYHELNMPRLKLTPKGTGVSVAKEVLMELRELKPHPIINMILKYKSWRRGITILNGYLELCGEDGIVHPQLKTCGAKSGRESCRKPNLQNVAKEEVLLNPYPIAARKAFRPKPGFVNLHFDYKGIQFKLAVWLTGDENLFAMVRKGIDLHVVGAEILCGNRWIKATKDQKKILRSACKNANFAKMFGAGLAKVSATLGFSVTAAIFRAYNQVFGSLDVSAKKIIRAAKEDGYITTILGRRLRIPSSKAYIATNYMMQGSEADILKRAQNRVHHFLEKATGGEAGLILPVHDEIIIEYPRNRLGDVDEIVTEIKRLMSDFPQVGIPLDVDVEVTTLNWASKKKYRKESFHHAA